MSAARLRSRHGRGLNARAHFDFLVKVPQVQGTGFLGYVAYEGLRLDIYDDRFEVGSQVHLAPTAGYRNIGIRAAGPAAAGPQDGVYIDGVHVFAVNVSAATVTPRGMFGTRTPPGASEGVNGVELLDFLAYVKSFHRTLEPQPQDGDAPTITVTFFDGPMPVTTYELENLNPALPPHAEGPTGDPTGLGSVGAPVLGLPYFELDADLHFSLGRMGGYGGEGTPHDRDQMILAQTGRGVTGMILGDDSILVNGGPAVVGVRFTLLTAANGSARIYGRTDALQSAVPDSHETGAAGTLPAVPLYEYAEFPDLPPVDGRGHVSPDDWVLWRHRKGGGRTSSEGHSVARPKGSEIHTPGNGNAGEARGEYDDYWDALRGILSGPIAPGGISALLDDLLIGLEDIIKEIRYLESLVDSGMSPDLVAARLGDTLAIRDAILALYNYLSRVQAEISANPDSAKIIKDFWMKLIPGAIGQVLGNLGLMGLGAFKAIAAFLANPLSDPILFIAIFAAGPIGWAYVAARLGYDLGAAAGKVINAIAEGDQGKIDQGLQEVGGSAFAAGMAYLLVRWAHSAVTNRAPTPINRTASPASNGKKVTSGSTPTPETGVPGYVPKAASATANAIEAELRVLSQEIADLRVEMAMEPWKAGVIQETINAKIVEMARLETLQSQLVKPVGG